MLTATKPFRASPRKGCYFNSTFRIKPNTTKQFKRASLKFPFSSKTRELFWGAFCWSCDKMNCEVDCLHHIFGRVSNSPFNVAPMNNNLCHINKDGKMGAHTSHMKKEVQQNYLRKTIIWVTGKHRITEKDKAFLNKYASKENLKLAYENFRSPSEDE